MSKLTEEQMTQLCLDYQSGESGPALARRFGISQPWVSAIMARRNVPSRSCRESKRRHTCDHHYFDIVDTEQKAYWLGFLAADGNVHAKRQTVSLRLSCRDIDHLRRFRSAIGSEHAITETVNACVLQIASPEMAVALAQYGVVPRKTFLLTWPELPDPLVRHYIRGFIDGDGSFYLVRNTLCFGVIGLKSIIETIQDILVTHGCIKPSKLYPHFQTDGIVSLYRQGRHQVFRIADYLYVESTIWLPRKRDVVTRFRQRYLAPVSNTP